jgi:hypothetical protein
MEAATEQEPTTIEERLAKLYAEMDVIVAKYIDQRAAQVIGVPRGVVEGTVLARAQGCRCEEYKIIQAKLEAERKLANALPEG